MVTNEDIIVSAGVPTILPEPALQYFRVMCCSWDQVPDDRTARMHFMELRGRLPAIATAFECRVVCESPTHLEVRYTIQGHTYLLVGLHSDSTVRTTLDEVREEPTNRTDTLQ